MLTRVTTTPLEVREAGEGRTLVGLAVPYGVPTQIRSAGYTETMAPGVFADATAAPDSVKVMAAHDHASLPIGRALSLTETRAGLEAELLVSDTTAGRDVLALVRDGVATGLSVGFIPIDEQWSTDRGQVVRTRATLVEVSVVAFPAYEGAQISVVRHVVTAPLLAAARIRGAR